MSKEIYVWKVRYDTRFDSSSGMDKYHINHKDNNGIVITREGSLDAVKEAIMSAYGHGHTLTRLHEAHFVGTTINDLPEA